MAIAITGVDLTLVGWLARNADARLDRPPREALDKAVGQFAAMSARTGHSVAEGGVSALFSLYNHDRLLKTAQASSAGTLHGRIESRDETASWHNGTLTLDRRAHPIPHSLLAGLPGRRLRDVVDAEWLADTARIVDLDENDVHVMLTCDTWITPLEHAREELDRRKRP